MGFDTQAASPVARAYGNGRVTAQRTAIAEAAARMGCAFTVEELAEAAREFDPTLGLATVYRAVSALTATGWLERVGDRTGSALYARCGVGDAHHHHLICTGCGRVEPAECPLAEQLTARAPSGFVLTGHDVTLYGLCPACAKGA